MSKKILLVDIFERYCEHSQCIHNYNKTCDLDDHISEYMAYKNREDFATCNAFEGRCGYCDECGSELAIHIDMLPYGDTYVPYEYYECDSC